jgi:hypothetical protein
MSRTVAAHIAALIGAIENCEKSGNIEWFDRHRDRLAYIEKEHLPSGSGVDCGVKVDMHASTRGKLVLSVPFHVMTQDGFYDGWRDYHVIVTPAFDGISVVVKGRNAQGIKEYLGDLFHEALTRVIEIPEHV